MQHVGLVFGHIFAHSCAVLLWLCVKWVTHAARCFAVQRIRGHEKIPKIGGTTSPGDFRLGGLGGGNTLGGIANTKLNSFDHTPGGGSAPLDVDARNGGSSQVTQELLGWGIQGVPARVNSTNIFYFKFVSVKRKKERREMVKIA